MTVTRVLPNICTDRMEETRDFYVDLLGFVVDAVHAAAVKRGLQIAQGLRDQDFGMRHFMIVDPNGLLVNVLAFP